MSGNNSEWDAEEPTEKKETTQETPARPVFTDSKPVAEEERAPRPSFDRRPAYPRRDEEDRRPAYPRGDDDRRPYLRGDDDRRPAYPRRDDDRRFYSRGDDDRRPAYPRRDEEDRRPAYPRGDDDRRPAYPRRDDERRPAYPRRDEEDRFAPRDRDSGYVKRRDPYDEQPHSRFSSYGGDRFDSRPREDYGFEKRPRQQREDPTEPNITIGIFNLSYNLAQRDFEEFLTTKLADFADKYTSKLIMSNDTGRCKGYGFVTFNTIEDSIKAKPVLEDGEILGQKYRVAFSIQRRNNDRRPMDNGERFSTAPESN